MKVRVTVPNNVAYEEDLWYRFGEEYVVSEEVVPDASGGWHPCLDNPKKGIGVGHFEVIGATPAEESKPTLEQKPIDSHYNFTYELSVDDIDAGYIKLDPYFVSKEWNIGSKDPSGVIWHIFKTCARFGEKNDKAREINAIYRSIKRLAELEGVHLD